MIFNRFTHVCEIIDELNDVWIGEIIKALLEVSVINVWTDASVEVLADVNANVLVAAMTALSFVMSAP